jgi:hypothetical protein
MLFGSIPGVARKFRFMHFAAGSISMVKYFRQIEFKSTSNQRHEDGTKKKG